MRDQGDVAAATSRRTMLAGAAALVLASGTTMAGSAPDHRARIGLRLIRSMGPLAAAAFLRRERLRLPGLGFDDPARLAMAATADYRAGRVLELSGIRLSATEAMACVAAAFEGLTPQERLA